MDSSKPAVAGLLEAVSSVERLFGCHFCCHDYCGDIVALLGKDRFPMEHKNCFCELVKGNGAESFNACVKCDAKAHGLLTAKDVLLKKCYAGAVELVLPVTRFSMPVGIVFIGPFKADSPDSLENLTPVGPEIAPLPRKAKSSLEKLPSLDDEALRDLLPICKLVVGRLADLLEAECGQGNASRKERMRYFFKRNHQRKVAEKDLADFLELSLPRVSQLLRMYFHKSFPAMLNECRLEFAESALLNSENSIESIARLSGFGSSPYFHRQFMLKHGMTPTEFRRHGMNPSKHC